MNTLNDADNETRNEYAGYQATIAKTCSFCDITRDYAVCVECGGCHSCCQCDRPAPTDGKLWRNINGTWFEFYPPAGDVLSSLTDAEREKYGAWLEAELHDTSVYGDELSRFYKTATPEEKQEYGRLLAEASYSDPAIEGFMRPCEDCSGTGAYTDIYDGYTRHCPTCDGVGIHTEDDSFEWNVDEDAWRDAVTAATFETRDSYTLDCERGVLWKRCGTHAQAFVYDEREQLVFVIVYDLEEFSDIPALALVKHREQLELGRDYIKLQESRVRVAGPRLERHTGNIKPDEARMRQR